MKSVVQPLGNYPVDQNHAVRDSIQQKPVYANSTSILYSIFASLHKTHKEIGTDAFGLPTSL